MNRRSLFTCSAIAALISMLGHNANAAEHKAPKMDAKIAPDDSGQIAPTAQ
jgi:hypothetical protein